MRLPILLFLIFVLSTTTLGCPDDCNCIQGILYKCPKNKETPDFTVHVMDHSVDISCGITGIDMESLKELNLGKRERFIAHFCPLPTTFSGYIQAFGVSGITVLSFSYSDFDNTTLSRKMMAGLESLTHLVIQSSKLKYLEEGVFKDTPALGHIKLQENEISTLPPAVFSYTPNLEVLDLSMNKITELPTTIFNRLKKLEILSLLQNQLRSLHQDVFKDLSQVTSLDLSLNKLGGLPENIFRPLVNLKELNLDGNNLKLLPRAIFKQNLNLTFVRLSRNLGLSLPDELFADLNIIKIYLTNNGLVRIPGNLFSRSNSIQEIYLRGNALRDLPKTVFANLTSLKLLDLQSNKLKNIDGLFDSLSGLVELNIAENEITHINKAAFQYLGNLEKLDFSKNKLKSLELLTFASNHNLKTIDGAFNELSFEEEVLPFTFIDVEHLILHHNHIKKLHVDFLVRNKKLLDLDLSYNQINTLQVQDILHKFQRQSVVNVSHNNISFVDFAHIESDVSVLIVDKNISDAQTLVDISYNPIDCGCRLTNLLLYKHYLLDKNVRVTVNFTMTDVTCASPIELQDVPLSNLRLETWTCSLDQTCAEGCECLHRPYDIGVIVDCSYRKLADQPILQLPDDSKVVYNHVEMHLEYNNLTSFTNKSMESYSNVTKLYLSHNNIENVTWLPQHLQVLKLDNNNISVLSTLSSTVLEHLTIKNNPWMCNDCNNAWLALYIRNNIEQDENFKIDVSNIKCSDTGDNLLELDEFDLCDTGLYLRILSIATYVLIIINIIGLFVFCSWRRRKQCKVFSCNDEIAMQELVTIPIRDDSSDP